MRVKVLFFGLVRGVAGLADEEVEVPGGTTVGGLWGEYERRFPRLREAAGSVFFAVNQEVTDRTQALKDGDEVAFMPPVSGGCAARSPASGG